MTTPLVGRERPLGALVEAGRSGRGRPGRAGAARRTRRASARRRFSPRPPDMPTSSARSVARGRRLGRRRRTRTCGRGSRWPGHSNDRVPARNGIVAGEWPGPESPGCSGRPRARTPHRGGRRRVPRPRRGRLAAHRGVADAAGRDRARRPPLGGRRVDAVARLPRSPDHTRGDRGVGGLPRRRGRRGRPPACDPHARAHRGGDHRAHRRPRSRRGRRTRCAARSATPTTQWSKRYIAAPAATRSSCSRPRSSGPRPDRCNRWRPACATPSIAGSHASRPVASTRLRPRRSSARSSRSSSSADALDLDVSGAADAFDAAERAGLIVELDATRRRFVHDLVRETLVASLAEDTARRHAAITRSLIVSDRNVLPARVAHHAVRRAPRDQHRDGRRASAPRCGRCEGSVRRGRGMHAPRACTRPHGQRR